MDFAQEFSSRNGNFLDVFQEPRGIMRVLQFIFAIISLSVIVGFESYVNIPYNCGVEQIVAKLVYSYPFNLQSVETNVRCKNDSESLNLYLIEDYSFDAEFYVVTCVLSIIYCICICIVYVRFNEMYDNNNKVSLADFVISVILGVFWLSSTAIWTLGLHSLKNVTKGSTLRKVAKYCTSKTIIVNCANISSGGYFGLNMSVIIGFLNFFLWASDLWFLYKETPWFQSRQNMGSPT